MPFKVVRAPLSLKQIISTGSRVDHYRKIGEFKLWLIHTKLNYFAPYLVLILVTERARGYFFSTCVFISKKESWQSSYLCLFWRRHTLNSKVPHLSHRFEDSFHIQTSQHVQVVCSWFEQTIRASLLSLLASLSHLILT